MKTKKTRFRDICGAFRALLICQNFFSKNWAASHIFLYESLTSCKISEKTGKLFLRFCVAKRPTNEQTIRPNERKNRGKFVRQFHWSDIQRWSGTSYQCLFKLPNMISSFFSDPSSFDALIQREF